MVAAEMYPKYCRRLGYPNYHEMLEKLHDELGIPGCGSFWDCLRYIKHNYAKTSVPCFCAACR